MSANRVFSFSGDQSRFSCSVAGVIVNNCCKAAVFGQEKAAYKPRKQTQCKRGVRMMVWMERQAHDGSRVSVCSDPVSSGSYQRGSGRPDQSHPAAALSSPLQTQRNAALHLRGLTSQTQDIYVTSTPVCLHVLTHASVQDYVAAMEDFQQSLELKKNQPIAMLYKGLTFFHRGMLKVGCLC